MVMVRELVHGTEQRRLHKSAHIVLHGGAEAPRVSQKIRIEVIGVLLHPGEKPGHRLHERVIVHDSIPLVSAKPVSGIPVMLRYDHSVRVRRLHLMTECFPEPVVELGTVSQIRSHVQSPAVRVIWRGDPFPGHREDIGTEFLRAFIVQLRKRIVPPPSGVGGVVRPALFLCLVKLEIISVGRGC